MALRRRRLGREEFGIRLGNGVECGDHAITADAGRELRPGRGLNGDAKAGDFLGLESDARRLRSLLFGGRGLVSLAARR